MIATSSAEAVGPVPDGAVVLIGGFGEAGNPTELVHALIDTRARHLTVVNNNAGNGRRGIRAGGAGVAAFFTRTAAGTMLAADKETREFNGHLHVLETAIRGDLALIKAARGDCFGNLVFNKAARNFNPVMCTAAERTVVQVQELLHEPLDPELIVTPGIYVDCVVRIADPVREHEFLLSDAQ